MVATFACLMLPASSQARGIIYGHIRNAETGEPVGKATIKLSSEGFRKSITTYRDGFYSVPAWSAGEVHLSVARPGMETVALDTVYRGPPNPLRLDFQLKPLPGGGLGGVSDKVLEARTGEPIVCANIIVLETRLGNET